MFEYRERLKGLIKERGKSVKEVAKECGLGESTLRRILSGKVNITFSTLMKFIKYFEVSCNYFVGLSDQKQKPKDKV